MISAIIGWGTFVASIVWAVKGDSFSAVGFLIATAIFWANWNLAAIGTKIDKIVKMMNDKVTAEKTLSALMAMAKKGEDDGK